MTAPALSPSSFRKGAGSVSSPLSDILTSIGHFAAILLLLYSNLAMIATNLRLITP